MEAWFAAECLYGCLVAVYVVFGRRIANTLENYHLGGIHWLLRVLPFHATGARLTTCCLDRERILRIRKVCSPAAGDTLHDGGMQSARAGSGGGATHYQPNVTALQYFGLDSVKVRA